VAKIGRRPLHLTINRELTTIASGVHELITNAVRDRETKPVDSPVRLRPGTTGEIATSIG
jgi:hypothetical protein